MGRDGVRYGGASITNLMLGERNSMTAVMKVGVECEGGGGG